MDGLALRRTRRWSRRLTVVAALALACSDPLAIPDGTVEYSVARFDGEPLVTDVVDANYCDASCGEDEGVLYVMGIFEHANGERMRLGVSLKFSGRGQYHLGPSYAGSFGLVTGTTPSGDAITKISSDESTGSATVTAFDFARRTIAGRFSFRADWPASAFDLFEREPSPISVEDGEFRAIFNVGRP